MSVKTAFHINFYFLILAFSFGCGIEEPQTRFVFNTRPADAQDYVGPWRDSALIQYSINGNTATLIVTAHRSDPEILNRPFPSIRLPWLKTGDQITERATAKYQGGPYTKPWPYLEMNARTNDLWILGTDFEVRKALDSLTFQWRRLPDRDSTRILVYNHNCLNKRLPCLDSLTMSTQKGLERLHVQVDDQQTFTMIQL